MGSVLSFSQYHKINEEDGKGIKSQFSQAADAILNAFFGIYGEIVPKIGEYKDSISDLKSLEREKTLEGKGKKMQGILSKVTKQIGDPYKSLQGDLTSLSKSFSAVWKTLIEDENAAKEIQDIQAFIEEKIDSYIESLLSAAKEKNKNITKKEEDGDANEAFNTTEIGGYLLVERVIWQEREELASTLTTFKTQLDSAIKSQKGVDATKDFRDKCRAARSKVDTYLSELADAKFDKLSRSEKKEKIDEIVDALSGLRKEIQDAQNNAFAKIGVESRIRKAIIDLLAKLKEVQAKFQEIDLKKEEEDPKKEEDDENDKNDDDKEEGEDISSGSGDYKEIKVGGDNASKKGKSRDAIKSWQVLYNVINPKKKIAEDGLFGRADKKRGQTEDAIVYTANLLGSLLNKPDLADGTKDGTVLTPEIQALTKIFVEKILPEMKKKMSTSPKSEGEGESKKKKATVTVGSPEKVGKL